ncbi:hypothetical protein F8388_003834 [Cannabis sativa]|uniref:Uncharacterized protein n=1 Tax=Cannabis sativa TaxID=3483 RepID=A0A7J6GNR2_CANSA|nr:hypothetical protein F8388_003834 [Cannabis sativa]
MWLKEEEAAAIIRTNWSSDNPGDIGAVISSPRILKLLCYITEGIATGEARKEDFTSVTNLLADPRSRA